MTNLHELKDISQDVERCFVVVHDPITHKRHTCGKPAVSAVADWPYCLEHQP